MEGGRETGTLLPVTVELTERIGWFIHLRWVAVAGVVVFVLVGGQFLSFDLHLVPILVTLALLALYNALATAYFRRMGRPSGPEAPGASEGGAQGPRLARWLLPRALRDMDYHPRVIRAVYFANTQMILDLLFLGVLLHFTGGIENPLRLFFLFHVIIAAILLSRRATYAYATLALLLMSFMALGEMTGILPHYTLSAHWRPGAYREASLVGTQLFLLGTALFITAYIASSIGVRLREKELEVLRLSFALEDKASHLEAAYSQLSAVESAKSRYMRKVAHELRGPLGTIQTTLGVALQKLRAGDTSGSGDLVARGWRRAGELAAMTAELLSLSRARDRGAMADLRVTEPAKAAKRILDEIRTSVAEADLTLTVDIQPDLPAVWGDPEGIQDLISNLLSNAIRYTPGGGTVGFRMSRRGEGVLMEVTDTGIGIEEGIRERVFEEFFRSDQARVHAPEGTGLGLAIVKAVVDAHGGWIRVESTPGKGSRFTVWIPAGEGIRSESPKRLETERNPGMRTVTHGGKGYPVDDQGFLQEWREWDEAFAEGEAGIDGGLTEGHWRVIRYIREQFRDSGECPLVFSTCRALGLRLRDLETLFPKGYLRGACRLAGISYRDRFVNYFGEDRKGETPKAEGGLEWATPFSTDLPAIPFPGKVYRIDEMGFLVDPLEWDSAYALHRAMEMKLPPLTEKHWQVLHYLRRVHRETGGVPTVMRCCRENGLELEELEALFPDGYHRGAVKLAGLCVRPSRM